MKKIVELPELNTKIMVELSELVNTKIIKAEPDGYGAVILTTDKGIFEITTFVEDGAVLIYKVKDLGGKLNEYSTISEIEEAFG